MYKLSGVALGYFLLKNHQDSGLSKDQGRVQRGFMQASVHERGPHPRGESSLHIYALRLNYL